MIQFFVKPPRGGFILEVADIDWAAPHRRRHIADSHDLSPAEEDAELKIRLFFAWFDLWIGAYWDRKKKILYVCPVPTVVLSFDFGRIHS